MSRSQAGKARPDEEVGRSGGEARSKAAPAKTGGVLFAVGAPLAFWGAFVVLLHGHQSHAGLRADAPRSAWQKRRDSGSGGRRNESCQAGDHPFQSELPCLCGIVGRVHRLTGDTSNSLGEREVLGQIIR